VLSVMFGVCCADVGVSCSARGLSDFGMWFGVGWVRWLCLDLEAVGVYMDWAMFGWLMLRIECVTEGGEVVMS
jgi:hypothetical protein